MFIENDDFDLSALGEFTGPDAPPKAEEKPAATPETPEPEKKPEAKESDQKNPAEKPEAEPDDESEADDEEFEDLTLDDIQQSVRAAIREEVADARKRDAEPDDEPDDEPDAVKQLRAENAKLKERLEKSEADADEMATKQAIASLQHSIASTAGKYKMTEAEIASTVRYMEGNEDLVRGGMGFEEAALRRLPGLADRLKTSPAPQTPRGEAKGDGALAAPGAAGPTAPKPWKSTGTPGSYADLNKHLLETGEAASLGKYT
jgi:hypothetical protein